MSLTAAAAAIAEALKRQMPPLIMPDQIGFCSPADHDESFLLGLFIYNISRDQRYFVNSRVQIDSNISQRPPFMAEISFMVTSYIGRKSSLSNDYTLLDRVLQIWHDDSEIPFESPLQPQRIPPARVEFLPIDADNAGKIWQFPGAAYRASLFFRAAPIAVSSTVQIQTPRVRDTGLKASGRGE